MLTKGWQQRCTRLGATVALVTLLAACGSGDAAPVETPAAGSPATPVPAPAAPVIDDQRAFDLAGALERPATLTVGELRALPNTTQTVTYTASGAPRTKTFVGTNLWALIDGAGVQVDLARRNDHLNHLVVARGADGYRAAFALGELNPGFGNRDSLLTWAEIVDGETVPLSDDGLLRVTSPGDERGGRYVSDLVRIDVLPSGSTNPGIGGGASASFEVSGDVTTPGTWDLTALQALPTTEVDYGGNRYRGTSLWSFLNTSVGLTTEAGSRNPSLPMAVVATGSDGYKAVIALSEIDPGFGNQPNLIAWEIDGAPLTTSGFARLVVPGDDRGGRSVQNLVALEVITVP